MPVRFLAEKHVPKSTTDQLRLRGIDIVRAEEVNLSHAEDAEILAFAIAERRTLLTHDADFVRLHRGYLRQGTIHYGIIYVVPALQGVIGEVVNVLAFWHEAVESGAADLERDLYNQLIYIS